MFPESAGAPREGRNSGSRASSTVHIIRRAQRNTGRFRGSRTVCAASRSGPESSRRSGGRGQDDMVLKQGHVCHVQVYEFLMINGAQRATEADASQRTLIGSAAEGVASRIPRGARWARLKRTWSSGGLEGLLLRWSLQCVPGKRQRHAVVTGHASRDAPAHVSVTSRSGEET